MNIAFRFEGDYELVRAMYGADGEECFVSDRPSLIVGGVPAGQHLFSFVGLVRDRFGELHEDPRGPVVMMISVQEDGPVFPAEPLQAYAEQTTDEEDIDLTAFFMIRGGQPVTPPSPTTPQGPFAFDAAIEEENFSGVVTAGPSQAGEALLRDQSQVNAAGRWTYAVDKTGLPAGMTITEQPGGDYVVSVTGDVASGTYTLPVDLHDSATGITTRLPAATFRTVQVN